MSTVTEAAADTRMLTVVHDALRRDLRRADVALRDWPPPPPAQQRAIGRHLVWMMGFLRAHHWSEDEGLYPIQHRYWLETMRKAAEAEARSTAANER